MCVCVCVCVCMSGCTRERESRVMCMCMVLVQCPYKVTWSFEHTQKMTTNYTNSEINVL